MKSMKSKLTLMFAVCAIAVLGLVFSSGQQQAGVVTMKASGAVTKGTFVKMTAAGTVAVCTDAADRVAGVCELTTTTGKMTKVSPIGILTTVTSGEAIAIGKQVRTGTSGYAYCLEASVANPSLNPVAACGQALTVATAAGQDLTILVLGGTEVPSAEPPITAGTYQSTWTASDTQIYAIGTRRVLSDGRVFRYSKAGNPYVHTEFGAANHYKTDISAVAPAAGTGASLAAGATTITVTVGGSTGPNGDGTLAVNQLAGGYVVIGNGGSQHPCNRRIVSNAVLASAGPVNIVLEAGIHTAITQGTTYIEVYPNPYAGLIGGAGAGGDGDYQSFLGIPAINATVGQYFWLQTKGPCWITSDSNTGKHANGRVLYFTSNGSVVGATGTTYADYQPAGYAIDLNASGSVSNSPLVMLQLE
jgi:hypothetical protein